MYKASLDAESLVRLLMYVHHIRKEFSFSSAGKKTDKRLVISEFSVHRIVATAFLLSHAIHDDIMEFTSRELNSAWRLSGGTKMLVESEDGKQIKKAFLEEHILKWYTLNQPEYRLSNGRLIVPECICT